ncbi:hypothetical protein JQS43_13475 [Natronosporangium hydrolyticum]|uniref:DUF308 domain-containing protein n=1 Tax=Natronosporangium hydrolyticum TaxID=2811111 RepID=A0A895YG98_9ACTN|nr:hypothetical protein [Natronosporangium hydrolyticum]QSB12708.1 hypothetical protein JQS43_13475 [Natronosporangium hydrolyticum]
MVEPRRTVVADPSWVSLLFWVGFPVLGGALGAALRWLVPWLLSLPWTPLPGPLRLVENTPSPWGTVVAVALGVLAGLGLAYSAANDQLRVVVTDHQIAVTRAGATTEFARHRVQGVFRDGKQLVLLGTEAQELAREASDLPEPALRAAFVGHGYRWHADGDPYFDDFRRWVPGLPELPPGADALFTAREKALHDEDYSDARQLRDELDALGVVVRDDQTRQFWRRHRANGAPHD